MDLRYRILTINDSAAVRKLLEEQYTLTNHLVTHLGIGNNELRDEYYSRVEPFLKQGNSLGAFDELEQLVAVVVNVKHEEEREKLFNEKALESQEHTNISAVKRLIKQLGKDDLPVILGTTEYWELKRVHPKYRRSGVMKELIRRTIELAKRKNIEKLVGFLTYEQPRDNPLGLYVIKRIELCEYIDSVTGKKIFSGLKPPHHVQILYGYDVEKDNDTSIHHKSHI
uniref:uncharacterized protein LOC120330138 n=1 Tax=Styela clava TaxID=7725 RepID=UPI00193A26AC|nr:uncharacterized protein LOC120330138 [Styela clava]